MRTGNLNELEIDKVLWKNPITRRIYMGTFPSNSIPYIKKFPAAMIVNFDEADQPGSHWVALYAPNRFECLYFDSFGRPKETVDGISKYLHNSFLFVERQRVGIQDIASDVCGHYAIYFIYMTALGVPYKKIENLLLNQSDRDRFVVNFVRNKIDR